MVRYLFYTIGDLTYQSHLVIKTTPENMSYANNQLSLEILMLQQSNMMITINDFFRKVSKVSIG